MEIKTATTKELLYADYRYKHCDGDCKSCPCGNEGNNCSETHNLIQEELSNRD